MEENKIAGERGPALRPIGNYRWVICGLLFFATTINYIDRQVVGILADTLKTEFHWNEIDYSNIVFAFSVAYAIGLISMGRLIDKMGTRWGYAASVFFWSLAAMAHAAGRGIMSFAAARFALGLGEAGNFPSAIKTIAEWFPKKERALATGIFNAGTNVGATVAPLLVPWITLNYGWRWCFIMTGAFGFVWLFFWLPVYRRPQEHPSLSKTELAYIESDPPDPVEKMSWGSLLTHRQTWAFALAKFMTDPIWWFYLYWGAPFLKNNFGVDLKHVGLPLVVIYLVTDVGSIGGGGLSSFLINRGISINRARKLTMLACALLVTPIIFAGQMKSMWPAVLLIALAAAAHQGWSANLFTTASDMFPRRAISSVVGIGGTAGALGGMLFTKVTGYILEWTHNYMVLFLIAGAAYLAALLVFHLLAPRLEPVKLEE